PPSRTCRTKSVYPVRMLLLEHNVMYQSVSYRPGTSRGSVPCRPSAVNRLEVRRRQLEPADKSLSKFQDLLGNVESTRDSESAYVGMLLDIPDLRDLRLVGALQ